MVHIVRIQTIPYKEHRLCSSEGPIGEGCIRKESLCTDKPQEQDAEFLLLNVAVHILVTERLILFFTCVFFLLILSASILLSPSSLPYIVHSQRHSWHQYTSLLTSPHRFMKPFHFILFFFFWFHSHLKLPSLLTPFVCVYLIHYSSSYIFFISSSYPEGVFVSVFTKIHGFMLPPRSLPLDKLVFLKCLFQFLRETVSHCDASTNDISFSAFLTLQLPTCLTLPQKNKTYMSIKKPGLIACFLPFSN